MAEVGDTIEWGSQGEPYRMDTYRVGYGYDLERVIDDETEAQWLERQFNERIVLFTEKLDAQVTAGTLKPEERDWLLQKAQRELHNEAGVRFGDVVGELDEYSRRYPNG